MEEVKLLTQVIVKNSFCIQIQSYIGKAISLGVFHTEKVVGLLFWKMQALCKGS